MLANIVGIAMANVYNRLLTSPGATCDACYNFLMRQIKEAVRMLCDFFASREWNVPREYPVEVGLRLN